MVKFFLDFFKDGTCKTFLNFLDEKITKRKFVQIFKKIFSFKVPEIFENENNENYKACATHKAKLTKKLLEFSI